MSKLFENKQQIIHIATEVIALIAITFYFSQKNRKLMNHIEDLAQRIEEQEDIIQKHEKIIKKMLNTIQSQQETFENIKNKKHISKTSTIPVPVKFDTKPKIITVVKENPIILPIEENNNESLKRVVELVEEKEDVEDVEEENIEENLDKELKSELEDLEQN